MGWRKSVTAQTHRLHQEGGWPSNDEQGGRWSKVALQAPSRPYQIPVQISEKVRTNRETEKHKAHRIEWPLKIFGQSFYGHLPTPEGLLEVYVGLA